MKYFKQIRTGKLVRFSTKIIQHSSRTIFRIFQAILLWKNKLNVAMKQFSKAWEQNYENNNYENQHWNNSAQF